MASVFTRIINGDIPGEFVWRDEHCVAFLSVNPLAPGHTLVVPREEVDHWIDLDDELAAHLFVVARKIGAVQDGLWDPLRVGLMIVGEEVPHVHLHVVPIERVADLDFANAAAGPPDDFADIAERLRAGLAAAGHPEASAG
jgi:histidine triad (HIT) family protein